MSKKEINVLELFAGVGGFRVGLERSNPALFKTKWANQWEPSRKAQDAFEVYNYQFNDSLNINENIEMIDDSVFEQMDADLIVGGFPCQDYSVARSTHGELGLQGKKGVLFWQIIRATELIKPKFLILENVDRLLKSPTKQRGRDFAVMLSSFNKLGYSVEWRVINAAEYGQAQRRRRVFLYVYRNDTDWAKLLDNNYTQVVGVDTYSDYIFKNGLFAQEFPVMPEAYKNREILGELSDDIVDISDNFTGRFWNTGVMRYGQYYTVDTVPDGREQPKTLGDICVGANVHEKYYITDERLDKFKYLRGPKRIPRVSKDGHEYVYAEGGMSEHDALDLPARTMLTSEGSVNRSTHLLKVNGRYRLLTPVEAERIQDFPDDWTRYKLTDMNEVVEVADSRRMFFMGNALVTGVVERIGNRLQRLI